MNSSNLGAELPSSTFRNTIFGVFLVTLLIFGSSVTWAVGAGDAVEADQKADSKNLNRPERLEWLQDAGFGMFIHWSVDCQIGGDISHVVADADNQVLDWYFNELPKSLNPERCNPAHWLALAKFADMRYAVFTSKHLNGFCWWDTATTDFNVMKTPTAPLTCCSLTARPRNPAATRADAATPTCWSPAAR